MTKNNNQTEVYWDSLYKAGLGAPRYPNGDAVRWLFGHFPRNRAKDFHILDMGTGMGRHAMLMAREGYQVTGTDISQTCLNQASAWAKAEGLDITFLQASADHQPFDEQIFDGIISYGVLYYLSLDKLTLAVKEIHRLLKSGGSAFVMVKSDRDIRLKKGDMISPHHYKISQHEVGMPWNNEVGMGLTLLPRAAIQNIFKEFSEIIIEETTSTLGNGKYMEAAWLIYAKK
ncbi:MAG: class I SAM-dependent methyltransferase [Emcibacter sp.]|nr:class I SAM-dependent methyltransferase [Emcibacter sp.]